MTTRTVTGNIKTLTDSAVSSGTVTFEKVVTSTTGNTIHQFGTTTATTDGSGDFSIALAVPASGSYRYRMILPNGDAFYFSIAAGSSINVATLIVAETITDQDAVVELLDTYFPVDVDDLTTTTGTSSQMLRVAEGGGLEYRTVAQVLADLRDSGALATADIGVLVASIGANTFTGTQNLADNLLTRPVIKDYGETVNAIGSTGGGTQDIDLTLGNVVSATVDTSANTFTFSNPSATGTACSFTLILTNGGSQTVNWPASVHWAGGTAPTLTAAGVDVLTFTTIDGGTTWYGFAAGLEMS